jgi:hypothetical protein
MLTSSDLDENFRKLAYWYFKNASMSVCLHKIKVARENSSKFEKMLKTHNYRIIGWTAKKLYFHYNYFFLKLMKNYKKIIFVGF